MSNHFRNDSIEGKKKIHKCTGREDTGNDNSKMKLKFDDTRSYLIISKRILYFLYIYKYFMEQGDDISSFIR